VEKNEENNLTSLSNIHLQNGCMLNKVRKEEKRGAGHGVTVVR